MNYSTSSRGRGNTGKKLTLSERNSFYLSSYQAQALIGLLLGDLYMRRTSATANARLAFRQGLVHETYACFIYNLFIGFIKQGYTYAIMGDWSTPKSLPRISISFCTLCLPCFNYFYDLFYPLDKKVVLTIIANLLTYVSLAFWIMDDGTF